MLKETTYTNRHGERLDVSLHPGELEDRLVILGHGVTGNKDRPLMIAAAEGLSALGWPCLRVSFSGNGESAGDFRKATVTKESEDLQDLIGQLPEELRLAYCGHSMGGAVGVLAASKNPRIEVLVSFAGMIRTAAFCQREFGEITPDQGHMWDEPDCPLSQTFVDDLKRIGDLFDEVSLLEQPFLLIHGTSDDVVLPEDSVDAHKEAKEPKRLVLVEGAEHSFDENTYAQVIEATAEWLDAHLTD